MVSRCLEALGKRFRTTVHSTFGLLSSLTKPCPFSALPVWRLRLFNSCFHEVLNPFRVSRRISGHYSAVLLKAALCLLLFGFFIHTFTLLCTLILASVCINLICAWIILSFLQLNSFVIAVSNIGNEMCSREPTWFQKWHCIFSLFILASMSKCFAMEFTLRKRAIHFSLCDVLRILHNYCGVSNLFWGKDN